MDNANDSRTIGADLAEARRRKGLSLEELSHRTKINIVKLIAIERDDMTPLHGGVFARGFLRAYAKEVGCDPEEIIRRYRAEYNDTETPANAMTGTPPDGIAQTSVEPAGAGTTERVDASGHALSGRAWVSSLAVVLLAAGGYWAMMPRVSRETVAATVIAPAQQVHTPSRPEVGTVGRPTDSQSGAAPDAAPTGLRIEGRSLGGPCWLTATADGQRVIYRLLNEDEPMQIDATQEVVLRIGDPSNFDMTINGVSARRLGTAGEAVTVSITPQNVREFIAQ